MKDVFEELLHSDKSISHKELAVIALTICAMTDPENDKLHMLESIFTEEDEKPLVDRAYGLVCWVITTLLEQVNKTEPGYEC